MQLRPTQLEISPEQPFGQDLLGRQPIAEALTEVIQSSSEGLVLALHAPWGQGKTTFLKMWRQDLINKGYKPLYFNAWEADFSEDPLIALISELEGGLKEAIQSSPDGLKVEVIQTLGKIREKGASLARRTIPLVVKLSTAGVLDLDAFSEKALADFGEKVVEERLRDYEASRKSMVAFRELIEQVAKELTTGESDDQRKPLVLIIDELDRCRPSFAVRLLECIKHLFAVRGVVFILAVDCNQLGHAVRSQYGAGMDATGYLRRFFDIELTLPEPDGQRFSNAQFERFGLLQTFNERQHGNPSRYEKSNLEEIFPLLFRCFECSLRDREKAFGLLSFAMKATPRDRMLFPDLLATLIVLRLKVPDLYASFVGGRASVDELLKRIGDGPGGAAFIASPTGILLEALLYVANHPRQDVAPVISNYRTQTVQGTSSESKKRAAQIVQFFDAPDMRRVYGCLEYLVGKIDLAIHVK